jgi:DNA primase large subunit
MLNLGTDEMAKYPFLAEAGQYLKDKGFTLDQFGSDPDLGPIIEKAYKRIETAATGKIYRSEIVSLGDLDLEVFSFLMAVILLKLSGMHTLIRRFSLAEARRAEKYLEKDLQNISNKKQEELAIKIIKDLFSMDVKKTDDYFVIQVSDYLKHSVFFHEKEWKLINRRTDRGNVFLTSHEAVRLIRKELDSYIMIKNAPDYNEKITLYQLNHLAGSSGSGTGYKCPSCDKVKTNDLCFATSDCNGIINPLQFKKKKNLNA